MSEHKAQLYTLRRRKNKMLLKIERALNGCCDGSKLTPKFMRQFVDDDKKKSEDKLKIDLRPLSKQAYIKRFEDLTISDLIVSLNVPSSMFQTIPPRFSIFL